MTTAVLSRGPFWKRWAPLFGAGMLGVASLVPLTLNTLRNSGQVPEASLPLVTAAATLQSSLILAGLVALGTALAPKLGLRSLLAEKFAEGRALWPVLRPQLPLAVGAGMVSLALVQAAEVAFRPLLGEALNTLNAAASHSSPYFSLLGLLYGGITEELWTRWGIMTFFAWAGWRLVQHGRGKPRAAIMWTAVVLAALLFGALHLPATATLVALTPAIVARALVLNGIAGLIFGWLFWRRSLEAAMVAHATFHAVLTLFALVAE